MNLVEMLHRNARVFGEKPALRYGGNSISFAELAEEAARAAGWLRAQGVAKGDRVAVMSLNTPAFVTAFYGALQAGAAVVPINHKLTAPETDYILKHSGANVFLFDGALAKVARSLSAGVVQASLDSPAGGVPHFDAELKETAPAEPVSLDETDLAQILYTSGTTGKPKGCMHTHRTVIAAGITGALVVKIDAGDRMLMAMPIWHSSPLNNWFLGAQYVGATTVLLREYHPLHFLQTVQDERCTVYFGAPISYIMPLSMIPNFADFDLSAMRAWIYGGGPIAADTAKKLQNAYGSANFYQVYGMTESGPTGTTLFPNEQLNHAGSIGRRPLPGADLRVVDLNGREVEPGGVGEIWLKADSMMTGYLDDPDATAAAFDGSWYKTGDVARMDSEGYLFIVDRMKDIIVTGGENVYSKEVEDAIAAHPDVVEAAVIGRPHHEWGETVTAKVVLGAEATLTEAALQEFLGERLARYKIPRSMEFVAELPHTPTGKIKKYELREDR